MPVDTGTIFIAAVVIVIILLAIGLAAFIAQMYRKVSQGQALIINKPSGTIVRFTGGIVIPLMHKAETMDISVKKIDIQRDGHDGLVCRDNIRADIRVTFFVRVNETEDDVRRVAKMVGCERASKQETLEDLFGAKFSEALKTAGKKWVCPRKFQAASGVTYVSRNASRIGKATCRSELSHERTCSSGSAPRAFHRAPLRLNRTATTHLHVASTLPEPIGRPRARAPT